MVSVRRLVFSPSKNGNNSRVYQGGISYVPFKGAKEIGLAEKNRIKLEDIGVKLNIESAEPFLPKGISAKVYGFFDLNRRTERVNSVRSYGSSDEKNFYQHIKR